MTVAATTAIRIPGRRGLLFSKSIRTRVPAPIASAVMFTFPLRILSTIPQTWRNGPFAVTEKPKSFGTRSEEHTSELQSRLHLVCRLLLEKKNAAALSNVVVLVVSDRRPRNA